MWKKKKHLACGIPVQICHLYAGDKSLKMILCILSATYRNETHARLIISVRISGPSSVCVCLCLSVCQSLSQSVGVSFHSHLSKGGTVDDIL